MSKRMIYVMLCLVMLVIAVSIVSADVQRLYSVYDTGYRLRNEYMIEFSVTVPSSDEERIVGINDGEYDYMIVAYYKTKDNGVVEHYIGVYKGQRKESSSWWVDLWRVEAEPGSKHDCKIVMENNIVKFIVDGALRASVKVDSDEVIIVASNVQVSPPHSTSQTTIPTIPLLLGLGVIAIIVVATIFITKKK